MPLHTCLISEMPNTIIDSDFPFDICNRGTRDERRHNKRVNDAVRKQIKNVIGQQDIITSEGNKKVKVKLKDLDLHHFRHNKDRYDQVGRDEFDDLDEGEVIYKPEEGDGKKDKAGDEPGEELYEAEYTIDELVDIMFEELELPDLDETKKTELVSEVLEWTDIRQKYGIDGLVDRKRTILSNILRKSKIKQKNVIPIIPDDLRYRTWDITTEKYSNAVVFFLMDKSGSMIEEKIYAVKALYFWIAQFLRRKYDKVVIKFIAHDYDARELKEKEFFTIAETGGTRISAAYQLCKDIIEKQYPAAIWNIYCFHASDGDSFNDEKECVQLVKDILKLGTKLFAYTEINIDSHNDSDSELMDRLTHAMKKEHNILVARINEMSDVVETLKIFLKHSVRQSY